ncbi:acyl-CoA dehydrogenase family protein [Craterilacuibacter sp. RT1T]|uniref:acyl-CoA dehydrogenase family protein n=1 Tax=Craterilacuibacter sp. RT1T TaxID=2942211 RepID=UPI0020C17143|nr:acyl-CoA dehydrogenase family protein [Craterilacuibacter sp. RT1T]MCL6263265.1 acyl-CoA/acyl-ACP dehydrogenase [Craterilacuibacter sp. RT1T]
MAFVLSDDQNMLKDSAADFFASRLPLSRQRALRDSGHSHDAEAWREMAALGWTAIALPEDAGGLPFPLSGLALIQAEAARVLAATPLLSSTVLCGGAIALAGSSAQQRDWLPALAAGQSFAALALDESPRHDPTQIALQARPDADGWVLNGIKPQVADGHAADVVLVLARIDAENALFILPANSPGIQRQPLALLDSQDAARMVFDQVRLSADALLARGAQADAVLACVLDRARVCLAAEMQAISRVLFDTTLAYLKQREQYGVLIGSFQALQHRMARLYTELELAESCVAAAVSALDGAGDLALLAALAKGKAGEVAIKTANEAVQLHGGIGVTDELDIGLYLKRLRVLEARYGDSTFQRTRYAQLIKLEVAA